MELLILIVGILIVYKFASAIGALSTGIRTKAEVFSEKIIAESQLERSDNVTQFLKKKEAQNMEIYSPEEVMAIFKVEK